MVELSTPSYARNMRILGHSDQGGGRADGVQIMVHKGHAYIGHIFSKGFSVVNVSDPTKPAPVLFVPAPPNTWTLHLQQQDDLLLVVHAKDMFAQAELADEKNYYKGKGSFHAAPAGERNWSAGLAVYDVSTPGAPRQIGFMPVEGGGLHRCWYTGGRWAYASALLDGFSDYILVTIDMADPAKPQLAGKYWLPGMNLAAGEKPNWPSEVGRFGLHHAIIHDDIAYCSWRDACLAVVDVADRTNPHLIVHKVWAPPFGGGTHNALPLPNRDLLIVVDETVLDNKEDGEKPIWVFDNRVKSNPISIATFPEPSDSDYVAIGGHFGPHNIYENRPNGLVSETLIFATYQNAGLRVFDISDKFRPVEVGACVPPAPKKLVDPRPNRPVVLHSADVFVDRNGICYCTDFSAGLYIVEYDGER
ncbi:MAG TPA: hypothetical protein VMA37_07185 [Acetobacteraceae bacterium]|nr:hypothetical protein [Acetobacteraceae bacterium]